MTERRNIITKLQNFNVNIKILPSIDKIVNENFNLLSFEEVKLEDLIERNLKIDLKTYLIY